MSKIGILSDAKNKVIDYLVNAAISNNIITKNQASTYKTQLIQVVNSNNILLNSTKQNGQINVNNMNNDFSGIYIDLLTLFQMSNSIDDLINRHMSLNNGLLNNTSLSINKIYDKLNGYQKTIRNKFNPVTIIKSFNDIENIETNKSLYYERYGESCDNNSYCVINNNLSGVTLPVLNKIDMSINNGTAFITPSIKLQLGESFIKINNGQHSLSNIIDNSNNTYWNEIILSDLPINVELNSSDNANDNYYNINNGAVCELELNFDSRTTINEISFIPYSTYPMEILAIRYVETDIPTEEIKEIAFPNNSNKFLSNKICDGNVYYNFPDIECKKLFILFRQIHYIRDAYIYNTSDTIKNELWLSAVNQADITKEKKLLFSPIYNDKLIDNSIYEYINRLTDNNIDIEKILFDNLNYNNYIMKYKYSYGFYNIGTYLNSFNSTGIYVSTPVRSDFNIIGLNIKTDEEHQLYNNTQYTDIEYYVTYIDNPDITDWYPILPTNISVIDCELLQLDNNICNLRFKASTVNNVFSNGTPLTLDVDYILIMDINNLIVSVQILKYNFNNMYTVSYVPDANAYNIDFTSNNNPVFTIDNIKCDSNSFYKLSNVPLLSDNIVVNITDKNTGNILTEGSDVINVTNIYNARQSFQNFTSGTTYQYYIYKNYIYFNQSLPSNYEIQVSYNNFVSFVRLKAIMRRNNNSCSWLTCYLKNIEYNLFTIR